MSGLAATGYGTADGSGWVAIGPFRHTRARSGIMAAGREGGVVVIVVCPDAGAIDGTSPADGWTCFNAP